LLFKPHGIKSGAAKLINLLYKNA